MTTQYHDAQQAEPIEGEWEGSADDECVIYGTPYADGTSHRVCVADSEEDARLIVACVNALQGLTLADIESFGAPGELGRCALAWVAKDNAI